MGCNKIVVMKTGERYALENQGERLGTIEYEYWCDYCKEMIVENQPMNIRIEVNGGGIHASLTIERCKNCLGNPIRLIELLERQYPDIRKMLNQ